MMKRYFIPLLMILLMNGFTFCNSNKAEEQANPKDTPQTQVKKESTRPEKSVNKPKVIFIELGSVNCIPCRMMQPVMKSVEKKYGDQLRVIFYDVWKPEQKHYAQQYGIRVIPTQVFLDSNGDEIFRHEGFFPEEELDKFLQSKGLSVRSNSSEKS